METNNGFDVVSFAGFQREYTRRKLTRAMADGARLSGGVDPEMEQEAYTLSTDLRLYVEAAWHVLEPVTPYKHNWHIDVMCEHLEAVSRGDIRDLLINVPPRCMKSLTMVLWMTWTWTWAPHVRWLCSSYASVLSTRDSVKARRVIQSPWYQKRWGHVYTLTSDQNVKTRFENDATGYRVATSVDGMATGEGGDILVFDDPHNVREGDSTLKRTAAVDYWNETMSTRRNDPEKSARVVIQQRVHQQDVAGNILADDDHGYVHLMLPMRYDPARACTTVLGFTDPRTTEGELLWPSHFTEEAVTQLERDLGPYGAAGQLQQTPVARTGGMFERHWFTTVPRIPAGSQFVGWVRYWDKAGLPDTGVAAAKKYRAHTVGVLMGLRTDGQVYVADVVRGQWRAGDREQIILETAEADSRRFPSMVNGVARPDPYAVLTVVEREGGSGGEESAQNTMRNLARFRRETDRPTGDKLLRADPLAGAAKLGEVFLLEGDWNREFLDELEACGPGAAHMDQVDAASGAYNKLHGMLDSYVPADGVTLHEDPQASKHRIA